MQDGGDDGDEVALEVAGKRWDGRLLSTMQLQEQDHGKRGTW